MNITNEIITSYLDTLYNCDNPKLAELRNFAEEKKVPIILKDTEGFLINLLKIKKPKNLLEIGAAVGYSSCCFQNACGCDIITIESDESSYESAVNNIKMLGYEENIEVIQGDARDVLLSMSSDSKYDNFFDFIFIDAAKSHYKAFWDLIIPLCKNDAIVVCDNVLMKGMTASDEYDYKRKYKTSIRKMREFIEYINNLDNVDTCVLPVGDGVSVSIIYKTMED